MKVINLDCPQCGSPLPEGLIVDAHFKCPSCGSVLVLTIPALVQALEDREPAVRYWAAEALGRLGTDRAVDALGEHLRDKADGVREIAEKALRDIGSPRALEILQLKRSWWPLA